jgi:hypothetical protein
MQKMEDKLEKNRGKRKAAVVGLDEDGGRGTPVLLMDHPSCSPWTLPAQWEKRVNHSREVLKTRDAPAPVEVWKYPPKRLLIAVTTEPRFATDASESLVYIDFRSGEAKDTKRLRDQIDPAVGVLAGFASNKPNTGGGARRR